MSLLHPTQPERKAVIDPFELDEAAKRSVPLHRVFDFINSAAEAFLPGFAVETPKLSAAARKVLETGPYIESTAVFNQEVAPAPEPEISVPNMLEEDTVPDIDATRNLIENLHAEVTEERRREFAEKQQAAAQAAAERAHWHGLAS